MDCSHTAFLVLIAISILHIIIPSQAVGNIVKHTANRKLVMDKLQLTGLNLGPIL
jgi:hypothetical protein